MRCGQAQDRGVPVYIAVFSFLVISQGPDLADQAPLAM